MLGCDCAGENCYHWKTASCVAIGSCESEARVISNITNSLISCQGLVDGSLGPTAKVRPFCSHIASLLLSRER